MFGCIFQAVDEDGRLWVYGIRHGSNGALNGKVLHWLSFTSDKSFECLRLVSLGDSLDDG